MPKKHHWQPFASALVLQQQCTIYVNKAEAPDLTFHMGHCQRRDQAKATNKMHSTDLGEQI